MIITESPSGDFYIARQGNFAVFDRCRRNAIIRLSALLWRMPPQPYFEESVSPARSRPKRNQLSS